MRGRHGKSTGIQEVLRTSLKARATLRATISIGHHDRVISHIPCGRENKGGGGGDISWQMLQARLMKRSQDLALVSKPIRPSFAVRLFVEPHLCCSRSRAPRKGQMSSTSALVPSDVG